VHDFLTALPFFTSPVVILDYFAGRFFHGDEHKGRDFDQVQTRIIEFLQEWVNSYFRSFITDPTAKAKLLEFINDSIKVRLNLSGLRLT